MPNSKKILIIDDDVFLSDIYSLKLQQAGFNVTTAGSGDLGLSEMQKEKPDLILLDIVMPGKSGIETLKKIRETGEYKDLKILLLTNMRDEETIKTGLSLGANGYLIKTSLTPNQVVNEVEKELGSIEKTSLKTVAILLVLVLSLYALPSPIKAENGVSGTGFVVTYPVNDKDIVENDVVCFDTSGRLERCRKSYDEKVFGVYISTPQIVLRVESEDKPIVREGRVLVNVSSANGDINTGDSLTSSAIPGKAQKATEPIGYILGQALEPFSQSSGQKENIDGKVVSVGKIEVALNVGPQGVLPRGTILEKIGYLFVKGTQTPQAAGIFLRYIMAGILTVSVSFFALNNFGRNINKGIEAIGRNPLARGQIHFAIVVNTVLVSVLVVGSIILGLIIIRI